MGPFHRGAAVWRARGCVFDWIWAAAVWLEARRNGLPDQRVAARWVCADGGTGFDGDRLRRKRSDGCAGRSDEQETLAAGADFGCGAGGESGDADFVARRILRNQGRSLSIVFCEADCVVGVAAKRTSR